MKSLLQSGQWAEFRKTQGWEAHNILDIQILQKKLFLGKSFLYAPEVTWKNLDTKFEKIYENTKKIAKNDQSIFFRLEILDEFDEKIVEKLKENGFTKAFEEVQPEYRHIIDISKGEQEILSQMKEKGRYNIRVAQKHGIVIEKSENINEFYKIFTQTAKRDGFEIRHRQYFIKMMQILEPLGFAELLFAKKDDKVLAAEIVTYYDGVASYLYGASSNEDRNLMAPYLLHWETIRRAKKRGCKLYDLLAVDPLESKLEIRYEKLGKSTPHISNPSYHISTLHKYAGIGKFKRQFGGKTIRLVGSWDLIFSPFWYKMFKIAEKLRRN